MGERKQDVCSLVKCINKFTYVTIVVSVCRAIPPWSLLMKIMAKHGLSMSSVKVRLSSFAVL